MGKRNQDGRESKSKDQLAQGAAALPHDPEAPGWETEGSPPSPKAQNKRGEDSALPTSPAAEQGPAAATAAAAAPASRSALALPWMREPVVIDPDAGVPLGDVRGMDPRLRAAMEASGMPGLFPVQAVVWDETAGGRHAPHDICLAAPTGSGKTLAYLLPLLNALAGRTVPALRALVVLPTRDLASQVHAVLRTLCPALGLAAVVACGAVPLATEAAALRALPPPDVLVVTPGRLAAHAAGTPGMAAALRSLRWLVVDETDRLLRQGYQNWLDAAVGGCAADAAGGQGALDGGRLIKVVASATLTRDPSKLARLRLHCPRFVATAAEEGRSYALPPTLSAQRLVVPAERKPDALAALLRSLTPAQRTLVFVSSVDATHRLYLLLSALSCLRGSKVVEYSAAMRPEHRRAALEAFKGGDAQVLVCSDAMTRGMDVDDVAVVVNYDALVYAKTYVHRAGRTARAGERARGPDSGASGKACLGPRAGQGAAGPLEGAAASDGGRQRAMASDGGRALMPAATLEDVRRRQASITG